MQNNVDDISTLREILQRHDEWQPTGDEKIDQYTLGPVILRTLNYFNADDAALAVLYLYSYMSIHMLFA